MDSCSETDSPRRSWRNQEKRELAFTQQVRENTAKGVLIEPRTLVQNLGMDRSLTTVTLAELLKGQYWLAASLDRFTWVSQIQREAAIFFSIDWIVENFPHKHPDKNLRPRKRYQADQSSDDTRDFRLKSGSVPHHIFVESNDSCQDSHVPEVEVISSVDFSQSPERSKDNRVDTQEYFKTHETTSRRSCTSHHERSYRSPVQKDHVIETQEFYRSRRPDRISRSANVHSREPSNAARRSPRKPSVQNTSGWSNRHTRGLERRHSSSYRERSPSGPRTRSMSQQHPHSTSSIQPQVFYNSKLQPPEIDLRVTCGENVRRVEHPNVPGNRKRKLPEDLSDTQKVVGKKAYDRVCPIKDCDHLTNKLKWHVYYHLPPEFTIYFTPEKPEPEYLKHCRLDGLHYLSETILGQNSTLRDLLKYVNKTWNHCYIDIKPEILQSISSLHHLLEDEKLHRFSLSPLNSVACMIHWRPLAFLFNHLTIAQRVKFQEETARRAPKGQNVEETHTSNSVGSVDCTQQEAVKGSSVGSHQQESTVPAPLQAVEEGGENKGESADQISISVQPREVQRPTKQLDIDLSLPLAFDSHFHLDRLGLTQIEPLTSVEEALNLQVGRIPEYRVGVRGGVLVFCDPDQYHDVKFPEDPKWRVAIGVHPKKINDLDEQRWLQMQVLLSDPRVTALGEVGLDYTVPEEKWLDQERILDKVLGACGLGHVLVLHIRGTRRDPYSKIPSAKCLDLVKKRCLKYQRIHLHCFSGDIEVYEEWNRTFPYCYFGFTGKVIHFDHLQRNAVRRVPLNKLLVETDSPYLQIHRTQSVNTPAFIGDIAKQVADIRRMPLEAILQATDQNGRALYGTRTAY